MISAFVRSIQLLIDLSVQRGLALVVTAATYILAILRPSDRRPGEARSDANHGMLYSVLVTDGIWWYPKDHLPYPDTLSHPYFRTPSEAPTLTTSLVKSGGRDALLTAAHFRVALLRTSWAGLRISSVDNEADRELSSGTASFPRSIVRIHDACVALQRNDTNYGHFITEILPSLVAWESSSLMPRRLVVAKSAFGEPLLRLIGFKGVVTQLASPCMALATDVTVLRLLPAGMYHPVLLREVARRAHAGAAAHHTPSQKVVFLTRSASATRRLTNEPQVIRAIRGVFPDIDVFYPGDATVLEQVARMTNAQVVISTFGAQAMNMVWATKMKQFVEITFYDKRQRCFAALAQALGASAHTVPSRARRAKDHYSDHECDIHLLTSTLQFLRNQDDGNCGHQR